MLHSLTTVWFIALGLLQASMPLVSGESGSISSIEQQLGIQKIQPVSLGSEIQLLGDVDSLSFYTYTGQQNFTKGNPAVDTSGSSLIYYADDTFIRLVATDDIETSTIIQHITPLGEDAFILSGNGTLLGNDLSRQLVYNLTTLSATPIFDRQLDDVTSILIDDNQVYFGGNFTYNHSHSVAVWNWRTNTTSSLPFGGFGSGSVINSIKKLDSDNLLFAGKFFTLDNSSYLTRTVLNSSSSTNMSSIEINPLVSLSETVWTIDSSSEFNSENFVCPSSQRESWFETGTSAAISGKLPYSISPTKLRVYNSPNTDNEISLFRITTGASNSILNMTYIDPTTGKVKYCDAFCPLFTRKTLNSQMHDSSYSSESSFAMLNNNSTIISWSNDYQDFAFANSLEINSLTFMAMGSYGSNVGLSGLQLYQNSFNSFANSTLNTPNCPGGTNITAVSLSDNIWTPVENGVDYISTHYTPNDDSVPQVDFLISLQYSGEYNINIYTPGCSGDGTCTSRGIVNVTVWNDNDNSVISTKSIYQNNDQLKYDNLFVGQLEPSTYRITLKYQSGLYASTSPVTVVADQVSVSIVNLDLSDVSNLTASSTKKSTKLNGLLQYQKSNFTSSFNSSQSPIANTSLIQYAVDHFESNSSIFASLYDKKTLLLGSNAQGVSVLSLEDDISIQKSNFGQIGGSVSGLFEFENSTFITGEGLNYSDWKTHNSIYNGTFYNADIDYDVSIASFANLTYDNSELLILNDNYIFNVSNSSPVKNNSGLSISLYAAGKNLDNEMLLFGDIARNQFSNIDGSVSLSQNNTIRSLDVSGSQPYSALYLNDSATVYAYQNNNSKTQLKFDGRSDYNAEWTWNGKIQYWLYSNNQSIIIAGISNDNGNGSVLSVFDTSSMEAIKEVNIASSSSKINSLLNFEANSTVMVGGDFSLSDVGCEGLCLFNYKSGNWSAFAGNLINGVVTDLEVYNESYVLISGQYNTKNTTGITLGMYDLEHDTLIPLRKDDTKLNSFSVANNDIVTWNSTVLNIYSNGVWTEQKISNVNSSSTISGVYSIQGSGSDSSLEKRDSSSQSTSLVLLGQFYDSTYGNIQALTYDFSHWTPYIFFNSQEDSQNSAISGFVNQDISSLQNTNIFLHNSTTASTSSLSSNSSSSSSTSATSTSSHKPKPTKSSTHSKKVHRGFVVLIGLALALGTVMLLGIFGVIFAALFRDEEIQYQPLTPHINDNDLANAQPPEKIMKFI
ncbi:Rax2 protein [Maudiozyma humilis]|uniref:Rax2 protein n=1 Tax=Maudiozyma humilis TaxID=51915 RepID=A0AAV5RWQ6_MAUHU|nr:Rax2 protein [Kazachstania humilis]